MKPDADIIAEKIANASFDLVISDLRLPDGDGVDLIKELLARRPIKAIAVTGHGAPEDVHWAKLAGFEEYLIKPVAIPALEAAIRKLTAP